ncbi:MAG: ABC transporter ATP-binding protein [Pseudomonadota bacterium]
MTILPSTPVIESQGINITVPDRVLVSALSITLEPAQWLVVLGRNGAGKTRTLRTLCGLEQTDTSLIRWCGQPADTVDAASRAKLVTIVTQHQDDAFGNDVYNHLLLARYPHHGPWRSPNQSDRDSVADALSRLGLDALAERDVTTLSGGERQRVAVAQALVQETPLLLVDEPLSHQDPAGSQQILRALEAYRASGGSVISAMHDVNIARRHADMALILQGDGGWKLGDASELICRETVTQLFGVDVIQTEVSGEPWFVPAVVST